MAGKKTTAKKSSAKTRIHGLTPMLAVKDLKKSIAFYRDVGSFEMPSPRHCVMDKGKMVWASIMNDKTEIMLTCRDKKSPTQSDQTIYYIFVGGIDKLHARLKKKHKVSPLRNTFYHMIEFEMKDPDGHVLWFGENAPHGPDCQH